MVLIRKPYEHRRHVGQVIEGHFVDLVRRSANVDPPTILDEDAQIQLAVTDLILIPLLEWQVVVGFVFPAENLLLGVHDHPTIVSAITDSELLVAMPTLGHIHHVAAV